MRVIERERERWRRCPTPRCPARYCLKVRPSVPQAPSRSLQGPFKVPLPLTMVLDPRWHRRAARGCGCSGSRSRPRRHRRRQPHLTAPAHPYVSIPSGGEALALMSVCVCVRVALGRGRRGGLLRRQRGGAARGHDPAERSHRTGRCTIFPCIVPPLSLSLPLVCLSIDRLRGHPVAWGGADGGGQRPPAHGGVHRRRRQPRAAASAIAARSAPRPGTRPGTRPAFAS